VLGSQARWRAGAERLEEAEAVARGRSDLRQLGEAVTLRSLLAGFRGALAESLAAAEEVVRIGTVRADKQLRNWGENLSVHALVRLGRAGEATRIVARMVAYHAAEQVGDAEKIFDLGGFALHRLALGELDEALELAVRVGEAIRKERFLPYFLKTGLDATCEVLLALLARAEPTGSSYRQLRADCREMVKRLKGFAALYPMARPRALIYQGRLAWSLGRRKRALARWNQALGLARALEMPYDAGRAHLELGRHLDAGEEIAGNDRGGHMKRGTELLQAAEALLELDWLEQRTARARAGSEIVR
jgi:tetratricopeptide (TPR) repeat protein